MKVQFNMNTKKVIVSSYEYGQDCCCFLDPDTPDWDAVTTYSLGDIVEQANSGTYRSKADNNLNHAVTETDWWTKLSNAWSCGNADWNAYSGYGGIGRTPKYMTVRFSGIIAFGGGCGAWPSRANRKFNLIQTSACVWACGPTSRSCEATEPWTDDDRWVCKLYMGLNLNDFVIILYHKPFEDLSPQGCCKAFRAPIFWGINEEYVQEIDIEWTGSPCEDGGCESVVWNDGRQYRCILTHFANANREPGVGVDWETYWEETGSLGEITSGCQLIEKHLRNCCNGFPWDLGDRGGTAYIQVGRANYVLWQSGISYSINDQVIGSDGYIYTCILGHTSSNDDRPITGENWGTYWELPNQECS